MQDAGWHLPENLPCGEPTKYMVPFSCAPLHCFVILCHFRRKVHRGGKEQMELWLYPTELWPDKLTAYRKQSVFRWKGYRKCGKGKKQTMSPFLKANSKKGSFQTPFVNNKCGKFTIWLIPNTFLNSTRKEGSWECCVTNLLEAARSCSSCAHHPSAGVCLYPFLLPVHRTCTPILLRAENLSMQAGIDTGGSLCWVGWMAEWRHRGFMSSQTSQRTPVRSPSVWHSSAWVFLTLCCSL